jgi:flagellin-like protein
LIKFSKNNRALSPVIASIILIAVVVAVSIAAASWMGSMSFNFMEVDELAFTGHLWASDNSYADLSIRNLGTSSVTVTVIEVNDVIAGDVSVVSGSSKIDAGETSVFRVTQSFTAPRRYEFTVITSSGTKFPIILSTHSSGSSEIWYNPSWPKRKAITVDNSLNPNDLVNYQVMVDVQYDSDMIADFSDLRFTDSDYQTLIPHWIESSVSTDHASVWVNVPFVPVSSTINIYMYYGNPSASSESDPDATFDLFVDFTRDGVGTYGGSQDANPAQWEIIGDTTLRMWGNNWKETMKTLSVAGDGSQAICFDFKSEGVQAEINGVGLDTDSSISESRFYRVYGTQDWGIDDHEGYSGGGNWQSYSLVLDDFSGDFDRFVFTNDADNGQATNVSYRNVRVRQYTTQQPSIDVSTEETL